MAFKSLIQIGATATFSKKDPSALQILLLSHTVQFSINSFQANVSLQQIHTLSNHVLPCPSLRPRHFREISLSQSANE